MSKVPHIADGEVEFKVVNIVPDFCEVDGEVCPFDIERDLSNEKSSYAPNVRARGERVLPVGSVIKGVVGNAGSGVVSGVSLEGGDVVTIEGAKSVFAHGRAVCRHDDLVLMNAKT